MLIRAVVHARLLGARLLTLDARVLVAEAETIQPALDAVVDIDPMVMPVAGTHPAELRRLRAPRHSAAVEPGRGVGHARELLAEGIDTLAGLRRPGR
jgi:hypothetical protein